MASNVLVSQETLDAIHTLPVGSVLVIDGTIAEMSVGYTMSCRGIDPDQMGVIIEKGEPNPPEDFTRPVPNVPLYIDKEILQSLSKRGKNLKIIFVPVSDNKCRFLAIAK
jgi:hypothetical protein